MADDSIFDLLHAEVVNYALSKNEKDLNRDEKEEDLSMIEYIGFSTGYRIIERYNFFPLNVS